MIKSVFLDDLYPDPFKARKGRVYRSQDKYRSTAAFRFSPLSSRTKAEGVVKGRTEVMLRIGRANVNSYHHVIKAADYIARHGKVELEDQDGNVFLDKGAYRQKLYEWKIQSDMGEGESKRGHVRRIILSMPIGTPEDAFKKACRDWAKDMLSGYDYLIAFHLKSNDERTHQPHCHVLIRTVGRNKKRFRVNKEEIDAFREHFAQCLMKYGIEANSTRRWSRGKVEKSLTQAEYNVSKNRAMSNEERARIYAISKKRTLLRNQQSRIKNVMEAEKSGKPIEDHPAVRKAKITRRKVIELAENASRELSASGNAEDRKLAKELRSYYGKLEPVESKEQRMLRQLNQAKAQQIRRMQAMKKRKRLEK